MAEAKRSTEEQALLLIVKGMVDGEVERYCRSQGDSAAKARAAVAQAHKRITIAANFARDEQLGKAFMRLESLYGRADRAGDVRTALQAQRELNRLLDLYAAPPAEGEAGADDDAGRRLALIGGYLKPLELTDAHYPVEEHARVAAELIRSGQAKAEGGEGSKT